MGGFGLGHFLNLLRLHRNCGVIHRTRVTELFSSFRHAFLLFFSRQGFGLFGSSTLGFGLSRGFGGSAFGFGLTFGFGRGSRFGRTALGFGGRFTLSFGARRLFSQLAFSRLAFSLGTLSGLGSFPFGLGGGFCSLTFGFCLGGPTFGFGPFGGGLTL
ncbi:MAG TPA: hypothetical protein VKO85_12375, partial [Wenzhouxiangellaceae bacterium]|nr:hypothetical protein [Wenzhouxiangellaceae bacterium]